MILEIRSLKLYPATIVAVSMIGSLVSPVVSAAAIPRTQQFLVTAYYSPLPDQCCYARGSYEQDILFNGEGIRGASGKEVYPGMIAAPPSYAFGTRIALDGIGVGTVQDRGGRIIEWDNAIHRIDLWMGTGEEGLKRAMHFGAQIVTGTVYPLGAEAPADSIDIRTFAAPKSALAATATMAEVSLFTAETSFGDHSGAVRLLQQALKEIGYFDHAVTGTFGEVTRAALAGFQKDFGIPGDGSIADDATRTFLLARTSMKNRAPKIREMSLGERGSHVALAQRVLRSIGEYRGRTDGIYDEDMALQITAFQIKHGVIADASSAGAGRLGPSTRDAVIAAWRGMRIRSFARSLTQKLTITRLIEQMLPDRTLARGDSGAEVAALQKMLATLGFFPSNQINGNYGALTQSAVAAFQLSRNVINAGDRGSGVFGPLTQETLLKDAIAASLQLVRAQGMNAL